MRIKLTAEQEEAIAGYSDPAHLRRCLEEQTLTAARAAVIEAAKAVDAERQERHPDLERKACGLEEGHEYWSPSGMMISADTLGPLRAAVARLNELEGKP